MSLAYLFICITYVTETAFVVHTRKKVTRIP